MARLLQIVSPSAAPFVEHVRMLAEAVGPEHLRHVALIASGTGVSVDLVQGVNAASDAAQASFGRDEDEESLPVGASDATLVVTRSQVAALAAHYDLLYIHALAYEPWMATLHHPKILACHSKILPTALDMDALVRVSISERRKFDIPLVEVEAIPPRREDDELPPPDLALLLERGMTVIRAGSPSRVDRALFWKPIALILEESSANVAVFEADEEDARFHSQMETYLSRRVRLFAGLPIPWDKVTLLLDCPIAREDTLFMPVREAMASGVPVVAAVRGSDPAAQEGGVVTPRTPEEIAKNCLKILNDAMLAKRLRAQGKSYIDAARLHWLEAHEPLLARFLPPGLDAETPKLSGWRTARDVVAALGGSVRAETETSLHPHAGHWSVAAANAPQQEALDVLSSLVRAARPEICLVEASEPLLPLTLAEAVRLNGQGKVLCVQSEPLPELNDALFRLDLEDVLEFVSDLEQVPLGSAAFVCLCSDRYGTFHDFRAWDARRTAGALFCAIQRRPTEYGVASAREALERAGLECLALPMPRGFLIAQQPPLAIQIRSLSLGEGGNFTLAQPQSSPKVSGRRLGALMTTSGTVDIELEGPASKRFDLFVALEFPNTTASCKVAVVDARGSVLARFGRLTGSSASLRRSITLPEDGLVTLSVEALSDVSVVWCLENARIQNEQAVEFMIEQPEDA